MSGSSAIPNYRYTSFEYADLTVIHSEPTYETLKTLANQLKLMLCLYLPHLVVANIDIGFGTFSSTIYYCCSELLEIWLISPLFPFGILLGVDGWNNEVFVIL